MSTGTWSSWGSWSRCSKSCGGGRSERERLCTGGSNCSGDSSETRLCNSNSCPGGFHMFMSCFSPVAAEVRWSNWGSWTTCTKSCGGGRSKRQRSCTGALSCPGVSVEERLCNSNTCLGVCFINIGSILWPDVCLIQLWSPGQIGDRGAAAQRAAERGGRTDVAHA